MKILLVEDNNMVALVSKLKLESFGHEVCVANTGKEAISCAELDLYDVILMDLGLGETTGYDVTEEIIKRGKLNTQTPIIALTAHSASDTKQKCLSCGMCDVLEKPLDNKKISEINDIVNGN